MLAIMLLQFKLQILLINHSKHHYKVQIEVSLMKEYLQELAQNIDLLDSLDMISMPHNTLLRVLSFILLKPLKVLDKRVLRQNLPFLMTIKDLFEQVFSESNEINEESPGTFPELDELITLAKP